MKACCFLQGFCSFIENDICFIHAIWCPFWVCIWAPLTYSIIGQYLNILKFLTVINVDVIHIVIFCAQNYHLHIFGNETALAIGYTML